MNYVNDMMNSEGCMGEVFIGIAKRVGIFLIAGQTILHFGVGKQYEKYVKLIISFMAAAQLILGFGGLFQETTEGGLTKLFAKDFEKKWENHILQFETELEKKQEQLEKQLTEEIQNTGIQTKENVESQMIEERTADPNKKQNGQQKEQQSVQEKKKNSFQIKIEKIRIEDEMEVFHET